VLVRERQAHHFEPAFLDAFIGVGRGLELLVVPQAVVLDEAGFFLSSEDDTETPS
jgi:hypothetical protein